jgi:hypothetical protein
MVKSTKHIAVFEAYYLVGLALLELKYLPFLEDDPLISSFSIPEVHYWSIIIKFCFSFSSSIFKGE